MGLIPARSGEVRWQDQNITHRKPHQRVQANEQVIEVYLGR